MSDFRRAGRLLLYRFIEDAWAGGLGEWWEGEGWLLVENAGQARWLSRKLPRAKFRIFDADTLREELARLAGIEPPPRHTANASLAVKIAAREDAGATREAEAVATACDALARAGWHLSQMEGGEGTVRRLQRIFEGQTILPGIFERRLAEKLPDFGVRLCCVGWDATRWADLELLNLAASKAISCEIYTPSPRLPADAEQRAWIEELERRFKLERTVCPESGFVSANETLVARLEKSAREQAAPPALLVGHEWDDQVGLVCEQVLAWLRESPEGPIGVVAPENSPTAAAVAEALGKAGARLECAGRRREPPGDLLVIEQIGRYHLSGQDIEELIELAALLWTHTRETWGALDPEIVRDLLARAFRASQSRNARILAQALPRRTDPAWTALRNLVEALGRWEEVDFSWSQVCEKWNALLDALGLAADPVRLPEFPREERVPGRAFMEWVVQELAARRLETAPPDYASAAPVVVTDFAGAAHQTWERLIFLDSMESHWPAPIPENRFLPDATKIRLNGRPETGAHLPTTRELRALDQARFLDLLEHCRGQFAFAGVLLEQTESGGLAQPNDWVLRSLIETGSYSPDAWAARARACVPAVPAALDDAERAHLEMVNASRHNGTMPFDRYLFDYHESKIEAGAWSATKLDDAITRPATFALRELFGTETSEPFMRGEAVAVGERAHAWLRKILGLGAELAIPDAAAGDETKLAAEFAAARRELAEWYGAEELPVPIWWETCLRKTRWAARRCLREVRGWLDGQYCAMEHKLALSLATAEGSLLLKGRIDIVISDRPEIGGATVRMFDFKTGRSAAPTVSTLRNGEGAQFAAYYLMARAAGAKSAIIGIIKPEARARDVFADADEEILRAHFGRFAALWRDLRFGRLGPLIDEHRRCETLPMATVPIDPAILEQKVSLHLLA